MREERTYTYQGMFLLSQATAADLAGAVEHINNLFARARAELLAMRKWDERRLAFEIRKQKRGVYILTYFRAPAGAISGLERDCNLSEKILRKQILRADHLSEEEILASDARDALLAEARMRSAESVKPAAELVSVGAPVQGSAPQEGGEPAPGGAGEGGEGGPEGPGGDGEQG